MPLAVSACRSLCSWSARGPALFACAGCGSEWAPTERWTPRQADGTVPAAVLEVRRAADQDGRTLSGGSAGAAGSAGS